MKKLLSAVCVLFLCLSLATPAFAAQSGGSGSDTGDISSPSGPLYDIYQVFMCDIRLAEQSDVEWFAQEDIDVAVGDKLASNFRFGKNIRFSVFTSDYFEDLSLDLTVGALCPDVVLADFFTVSSVNLANGMPEQYFIDELVALVDMQSEPLASGLTLSELNSYAADAGYYLIVNTPGTVGANDGYTRAITSVVNAGEGFDITPKAVTLEMKKQVTVLGGVAPIVMQSLYNYGSTPINATEPEPIISANDELLIVAGDIVADSACLYDNDDMFSDDLKWHKSVPVSAADVVLYKLTAEIDLGDIYESFPERFYCAFQDYMPDGYIGGPIAAVVDVGGYSIFADSGDLFGAKYNMFVTNKSGAIDADNLRSAWDVHYMLCWDKLLPSRSGNCESAMKVTISSYFWAIPVLDGSYASDKFAAVADVGVNRAQLVYQNNPMESVVSVYPGGTVILWKDLRDNLFYDMTPKSDEIPSDVVSQKVYVHNTTDIYASGSADIDDGALHTEYIPKQLSLATTVMSDSTTSDTLVPGFTLYFGTNSGNPIKNAKFNLVSLDRGFFAAGREPVFSVSDTGLFRKLTSGAYTCLDNLAADRYADDLHYQAHASHLPNKGGYLWDNLVVDTEGGVTTGLKYRTTIETDENGMVCLAGLPLGPYYLELAEPVQGVNDVPSVFFQISACRDDPDSGLPIRTSARITSGPTPTRPIYFFRPQLSGNDYGEIWSHIGDIWNGVAVYDSEYFPSGPNYGDYNDGDENAPELVCTPDGWFYLNLIASSGLVLPTTGGDGTVALIAAGTFLTACAGVVIYQINRRKRAA